MKTHDPYLSATQLGVRQEVKDIIIDLADRLARGDIKKRRYPNISQGFPPRKKLKYFNMATIHCGSVGCFKGWIESQICLTADEKFALQHLFYPDNLKANCYKHITAAEAAREAYRWLSIGIAFPPS